MKKGWKIKRLGDLCDIYQPKTISKKDMQIDGKYSVFGANGIIGKYDKFNHEEPQLLVTCRGATCGSVNISIPYSWINGNAMVIRPFESSLDIKFVEYFFRGVIDISKVITGAAQPQITRQTLSPVLISYPKSLPEQKRIVAILDKAFTAIDKAKANAEANLQNAKELFESYLQSVFENRGEDWEEKKLGEVCEIIAGQSPESKFYNSIGEGLPFYQGKKEFTDRFIGDAKTWTTKITKEAMKNDILMSVRAPVGPINFSTQNICIGRGLAAIRTRKLIDKDFLFSFLLNYKKSLIGNTGAVFNSINKTQIGAIKVPFPQLIIQQQIVQKLDTLSAKTQKLESIYQQKLADLAELKKSILQKAFTGELS